MWREFNRKAEMHIDLDTQKVGRRHLQYYLLLYLSRYLRLYFWRFSMLLLPSVPGNFRFAGFTAMFTTVSVTDSDIDPVHNGGAKVKSGIETFAPF